MQQQHDSETAQLKDAITQMETHIGNLQDMHSKTSLELIVSGKQNENNQRVIQQLHNQIKAIKKKEIEDKQAAKTALERERKLTDQARAKLLDHERCERTIYKKTTMINELRAKVQKMEIEERHKEKTLLQKRNQIEEEKKKLR